MQRSLNALVAALLAPVPIALGSEEAAINLVMCTRWPEGRCCLKCGERCVRSGIHLSCRCRRRPTIFVGTPLSSLRAPCVRGLLLALRAMMLDKRGIAARPLAKELGAAHVTLWRHLHRLRALLPELEVTAPFYDVLICGRHGMRTASVSVGKTGMAVDVDGYPGGRRCRRRLVGENIRTWVNGTFHGVGPDYLESYVKEAACRARGDPEGALSAVIALLL